VLNARELPAAACGLEVAAADAEATLRSRALSALLSPLAGRIGFVAE
jgi:hypothetical protein